MVEKVNKGWKVEYDSMTRSYQSHVTFKLIHCHIDIFHMFSISIVKQFCKPEYDAKIMISISNKISKWSHEK